MNLGNHVGQASSLPVRAASLPPKCSAGKDARRTGSQDGCPTTAPFMEILLSLLRTHRDHEPPSHPTSGHPCHEPPPSSSSSSSSSIRLLLVSRTRTIGFMVPLRDSGFVEAFHEPAAGRRPAVRSAPL